MNFTFGIVTGGAQNPRESIGNDEIVKRIFKIIESIEKEKISEFEVIIVGGSNDYARYDFVKHIDFEEPASNGRPGITKKKNIITSLSKYENIVYMHDYFSLGDNWYESILNFEKPWDLMMNKIIDINGNRFHDWVLYWDNHSILMQNTTQTFLPYHVDNLSKYQYISGGYWIAKKYVMEEFPLDESIGWGDGEDVRWSKKVLNKYSYKMNEKALVKLLKPRFANEWSVISEENIKILQQSL